MDELKKRLIREEDYQMESRSIHWFGDGLKCLVKPILFCTPGQYEGLGVFK